MTVWDEDQRLIQACLAGNREAFGGLVDRHKDRLYPTVFRMTGCAQDADDLLQEAFLKAYLKLNRFHGESSFYTWIYRITVNLALSARRRRRRPVLSFDDRRRAGGFEPADDPSRTDPSLPIERAERDQRVQEALDTLAPDHRAVVVMKDLDGLRYEEIADVLRIPVGTVRSRLHRARGELRERLRDLIEDDTAVAATTATAGDTTAP